MTTKAVFVSRSRESGNTEEVASAAEAPQTAQAAPASAPKASPSLNSLANSRPAARVAIMVRITIAAEARPRPRISAKAMLRPNRAIAQRSTFLIAKLDPGVNCGRAAARCSAMPIRSAITGGATATGRPSQDCERLASHPPTRSAENATAAVSSNPGARDKTSAPRRGAGDAAVLGSMRSNSGRDVRGGKGRRRGADPETGLPEFAPPVDLNFLRGELRRRVERKGIRGPRQLLNNIMYIIFIYVAISD